MFGSIAGKAQDAVAMFWVNLSDDEKRILIVGTIYVVSSLIAAMLNGAAKAQERELLKSEILADLRGHGSRT